MKVFNKMTIKLRVLLLAIIPMLFVSALVFEKYSEASAEKTELKRLLVSMELAVIAGDLLNAAQNERDISFAYSGGVSGFANTKASFLNADKFQARLLQARKPTDIKFAAYKDFFQKNKAALPSHIVQYAQAALDNYAKVQITRRALDARDMAGPTEANIHRWTLMILEVVKETVSIAKGHAKLSQLTNLYAAIASLSEDYSRRRAGTIRAIDLPTIDWVRYGTMRVSLDFEKEHVAAFERYATPEVLDYFRKQHFDTPAVSKERNDMKKIMKKAGTKSTYPLDDFYQLSTTNLRNLKQVERFIVKLINNTAQNLIDKANSAVVNSILLFIGVLAIIAVLSFFLISSILTPLKNLVTTLGDVAQQKDVSTHINYDGDDELRALITAFNDLLASFKQALSGVKDETIEVNQNINSMSAAMEHNQNSMTAQQAATGNVSTAISQMASTIEEVSRTTNETSDAAQRAHDTAVNSATKANDTKDLMQQLVQELNSTGKQVNALNTESESIGAVLNVIQSIAEQTNLLALNAAIEAARAGEQGRGFAVVADEVRSLAGRTQESTEQIKQQIDSLQAGTSKAVSVVSQLRDQGLEAVDAVVDSVGEFETLKAEMQNIRTMSAQIATAATEQSAVSNEIKQQVETIQNNAGNVSAQVANAVESCEQLVASSDTLRRHVGEFKI